MSHISALHRMDGNKVQIKVWNELKKLLKFKKNRK